MNADHTIDLFDYSQETLCKHVKNFKPIFKDAKIFMFELEEADDDVARNIYSRDDFFLPYPTTALMLGKKHMCIFTDTKKDQLGIDDDRGIILIENFGKPNPFDKTEFSVNRKDPVLSVLVADWKGTEHNKTTIEINCTKAYLLTKTKILKIVKDSKDLNQRSRNYALFQPINDSLNDLLTLISVINNPDNFILEKRHICPSIKRKKSKKPRLLKRSERPEYTILKPSEIRKRMGLEEPKFTGGKKRPHERKRHESFLSNPKYRFDKKGRLLEQKIIPYGRRKGELYYKKINVPAIWIGPTENIVGNHRYRVILTQRIKK